MIDFDDIRAPLRMNCNNSGGALIFYLAPSSGQDFDVSYISVYDFVYQQNPHPHQPPMYFVFSAN